MNIIEESSINELSYVLKCKGLGYSFCEKGWGVIS